MHSESGGAALRAIRDHIVLAQTFIAGLNSESFVGDRKTVYAVIRCLEVISEASRRVDGDLKARHPAIPWVAISGAGNIYRHDYEDVLESFIWRTVTDSLPPLLAVMEHELGRTGA
jgi:uncharacterized protein with HEPN domain